MPGEMGPIHFWLIEYLDRECTGLAKAQHRDRVLEAARAAGMKSRSGIAIGDSALRIAKEECIENGHLICATQRQGYWRPTSEVEVALDIAEKMARVADLSAKARKMQEVAARVFGPQHPLPDMPLPGGDQRPPTPPKRPSKDEVFDKFMKAQGRIPANPQEMWQWWADTHRDTLPGMPPAAGEAAPKVYGVP